MSKIIGNNEFGDRKTTQKGKIKGARPWSFDPGTKTVKGRKVPLKHTASLADSGWHKKCVGRTGRAILMTEVWSLCISLLTQVTQKGPKKTTNDHTWKSCDVLHNISTSVYMQLLFSVQTHTHVHHSTKQHTYNTMTGLSTEGIYNIITMETPKFHLQAGKDGSMVEKLLCIAKRSAINNVLITCISTETNCQIFHCCWNEMPQWHN